MMGAETLQHSPVDEIGGEAMIVWKREKIPLRPTLRNY